MDLVVEVERQPQPGDTVLGGDAQTFPGGKGANQAAAAAKAGGQVVMLGCVGSDGYGQTLRNTLSGFGVDVAHIETVAGASGLALITVDTSGQNMIVVSPGANGHFKAEDAHEPLLQDAALLVMQLEIPLATVTELAELARRYEVPVLLNPAPAQALDDALLSKVSYLVTNQGEAEALSGRKIGGADSAIEAAEALKERGCETVVITLGGDGLVWASGNEDGYLPAHKVEVVDTTAAGDAFCGALAVKLAEGCELGEAVRFANAAGALATTKEGAQPSLPASEAILALLS